MRFLCSPRRADTGQVVHANGGRSGISRIVVGAWRTERSGPMQIVSGPIGRERVHYEAPAAARLEHDMQAFLQWFEGGAGMDPVLKAAIAMCGS